MTTIMLQKKLVLNKVYKYLKNIYPDKFSVALALSNFAHTHGEDKVENLYHFAVCWEKMMLSFKGDNHTNMICQTMAHDLGIANEPTASPRSGIYTKKYVEDFHAKMADIEKEKALVTNYPIKDIALLISNLKYEVSRKILEQRIRSTSNRSDHIDTRAIKKSSPSMKSFPRRHKQQKNRSMPDSPVFKIKKSQLLCFQLHNGSTL